MRVIVEDTRNQKDKHYNINSQLAGMDYKIVRSKLFCGDYTYLDKQDICIDTKKDLQEVIGNVTKQHNRFINEIKRANENGIKLIFLVEQIGIETLEDVEKWVNPRLKKNKKATTGEVLYKILKTIEERYDTKFYFCNKFQTGKRLIELLG